MTLTMLLGAANVALTAVLVVSAGALVLLDLVVGFLTHQPSGRKRLRMYRALLAHLIRTRRQGGSYLIDPGPDWAHVQIVRYPDAHRDGGPR